MEITLSGLDGHGQPTASLAPAPVTPATPAAAKVAKKPAAVAAKSDDTLPEGVSVQPVTGTATTGHARAHVATPQTVTSIGNGLDLAANGTSVFTSGSMRYVYANLKVRNAQACIGAGSCTAYRAADHNLTLVAAETASTINQTAVSKMKLFDGTAAASSIATSVVPTDGVQGNANNPDGKPLPAPGLESLQVYTENEVSAMPTLSGVTSLLPYGFVVRNVNSTSSRALPGSPANNDYEGAVTIAVAFPVQSTATANPFSISLVYEPVDDTNTRVTQSLEDDNAHGDSTSTARAAALGTTDLAVLGAGHATRTNNTDPICTVRTAGTASAPTAYLVQNSTPNVASVPARLPSGTWPLTVGFCSPIATQSSLWSEFVVTGSASGVRSPSSSFSGSYVGSSTNRVTFNPALGFYTGERVSITLTSALTSTSGTHPAPYVAETRVGTKTVSSGQLTEEIDTKTDSPVADVAAADLNGDGRSDLVVVSGTPVLGSNDDNEDQGEVSVFLSNPDGTLRRLQTVEVDDDPTTVAVGDVNGDGIPDVVVGEAVLEYHTDDDTGALQVLLGTGSGALGAPGAQVPFAQFPDQLVLADFNHDGKLDVAMSQRFGSDYSVEGVVRIADGNGSGGFTGAGTLSAGSTADSGGMSIAAGDFNGDGVADLAMASTATKDLYVSVNNGTGGFTIPSAYVAPLGVVPDSLAVGNFSNHDGKLDALVGGANGAVVQLLGGNSSTAYFGSPSTVSSGTGPVVAVAEDTDTTDTGHYGDIHAVRAPNYLSGQKAGTFDTTAGTFGVGSVVLADTAGIGHPGTAITGGDHVHVYLRSGNGAEAAESTVQTSYDSGIDGEAGVQALTLGDVAPLADSPAEVAVGIDQSRNRVTTYGAGVEDDGTGNYIDPGANLPTGAVPTDVKLADFDGDGILDLVVVGSGTQTIYTAPGDGYGNFSGGTHITLNAKPARAVVADVNADGHPDIVASIPSANEIAVILGSGGFTFSSPTYITGFPGATAMDIGDVNEDGALDLAIADPADSKVELAMGNNTGSFTVGATYAVGTKPTAVAVGDINGDGVDDIVTANQTGNSVSSITFSPTVGNPVVTTHVLARGASQPFQLAVGDLNGDGYDDVVTADYGSDEVSYLDGGPSGLQEAATSPVTTVHQPDAVALDGNNPSLRVVVASFGSDQLNLLPQVQVTAAGQQVDAFGDIAGSTSTSAQAHTAKAKTSSKHLPGRLTGG